MTLLIVDQQPSGIDPEVMSQVDTRVTWLLSDEADVRAVLSGISGAAQAAPALIQALHDERAGVRAAAAVALGKIGPETTQIIPALIQLLEKDGSFRVRSAAIAALGRVGSGAREAILAITQALQDRNRYVRQTAAQTLESIGPRGVEAVPALIQALQDKTWSVCQDASLWREWWEGQR